MAGKLGRLAPHSPETHPRLMFANYLQAGSYPPAPPVVDYVSKVPDWPMYLNDRYGDCTCAAAGHMIEAWTEYGAGATVKITDDEVLTAYEAVSGFDPKTGANDNGAVMQDVLDYWRKTGIGGHKILAFAQIDVKNAAELDAAMNLFGHLYLGINFPETAMKQFDKGQPWDVVSGAKVEGGHAIDWGYVAQHQNHKIITWGKAQEMTAAFFDAYVEEAWVVLNQEWIKDNKAPAGFDIDALNADFTAMTGQPGPFTIA